MCTIMQAALPDEGGVELCVHKHHHLKGHGDAQAADAGHRRLQPEQTWGVGETREREINTLSIGVLGSVLPDWDRFPIQSANTGCRTLQPMLKDLSHLCNICTSVYINLHPQSFHMQK